MSAEEIDRYLDALTEPKRATLARLRQTILDIVPEAEQGISYGVPAFKVAGKTIAGFAASRNHLSYLPHSGAVFPQLSDELRDYSISSGPSASVSASRWSRNSSRCGWSKPFPVGGPHQA